MRKIVDYTIAQGCELVGLSDSVKGALKHGWQPYGQAFITAHFEYLHRTYYAQPMVKYEEED